MFELQLLHSMPAVIAQLVEHQALGHGVTGLNLLAVLEVTLSGYSNGCLTIPRCKIGTRPGLGNQNRLEGSIMHK